MKRSFVFLITLLTVGLIGCAMQPRPPKVAHKISDTYVINKSNLVEISYETTDHLLKNLKMQLNHDQNVLVASFVHVKSMELSSDFGRIMAEFISSRLSQKGYAVVELKFRNSIYMKEQAGEFLLTRAFKEITAAHDAQAVIVGTYTGTRDELYVSARIVDARSGKIISSFDYRLALDKRLKQLLSS